jgi:hypothetical protein
MNIDSNSKETRTDDEASTNDQNVLENFPPASIHQVLLTDPTEFDSLTVSGLPRAPSLSFQRHMKIFQTNVTQEFSLEEQIANTMQRAYNDMLLTSIHDSQSYAPFKSLLLELVELIQTQIIPRRTDFRNQILSLTQSIKDCDVTTLKSILLIMIHLGQSIIQLESEERAATTLEWVTIAKSCIQLYSNDSFASFDDEQRVRLHVEMDSMRLLPEVEDDTVDHRTHGDVLTFPQFGLASVTYLIEKANQCVSDIDDWKWGHVIAPLIHLKGKEYEYKLFEQKFGIGTESDRKITTAVDSAKYTRFWVEEIINDCEYTLDELIASEEKRCAALVQTGWVDNILFRSPRGHDRTTSVTDGHGETLSHFEGKPFHMPEILYMDVDAVKIIRSTTSISVVCSALALHAATVAGVNDSVLKQVPLDPQTEECKRNLIFALKNRTFIGNQQQYEENVSVAVIQLASSLNPNLFESEKEMLKSRSTLVLKNEDPVIRLLDNRMRQVFRVMVLWNPHTKQQLPTSIRTGHGISSHSNNETKQTHGDLFKAEAKHEFISKGFSLNAEELAEATMLASRVINLALQIYMAPILDNMFHDIISKGKQAQR